MNLTEEEWRKKLTPLQYEILRQKGTESPFSGKLLNEKRADYSAVLLVGRNYFPAITNLIQALAGQVFMTSQSQTQSI